MTNPFLSERENAQIAAITSQTMLLYDALPMTRHSREFVESLVRNAARGGFHQGGIMALDLLEERLAKSGPRGVPAPTPEEKEAA